MLQKILLLIVALPQLVILKCLADLLRLLLGAVILEIIALPELDGLCVIPVQLADILIGNVALP